MYIAYFKIYKFHYQSHTQIKMYFALVPGLNIANNIYLWDFQSVTIHNLLL